MITATRLERKTMATMIAKIMMMSTIRVMKIVKKK